MNDGYTFKDCNICNNYNEKTKRCDKHKCMELQAIEHILSDYKRVLKENEEAKATEKDYNMLKEYYKEQNEVNARFIPVQKVKDKIEELKQEKKKYGNCLIEMYEDELVNRDIKILQELLESEE